MITVPEATKKIIERSRYLSEAISKGIINYSSLARYIKPELEQMLMKKISNASVVMALNRLEPDFQPKYKRSNIFKTNPEIIVRSNLCLVIVQKNNSDKSVRNLDSDLIGVNKTVFKTEAESETVYVLRQDSLNTEMNNHKITRNLSAISIKLPNEAQKTAGIYYFFIKSLAWEGINILEIVSTPAELTFIFEDQDIERAFSIIKSLFV